MQSTQEPVNIRKIAFAPFISEPPYLDQESEQVRVVKERFLTDALYNELTNKVKGVDITSLETATSEIEKVKEENPGLTYKDTVLRVGKNLDADAVLIGNISNYSERRGGDFGVESPASVVFEVQLFNATNGEVIWEAYFNETQRTLLENVAEIKKFIKRRAKWITADELAKEGVVEVVNKLNKVLITNSAKN
ncbi:MAG: hypothetical protein HYW01_01325 [Deltaproteobacteria bacterium]|nr:hypothetical protein [Deltaproteobacteria bacterium]